MLTIPPLLPHSAVALEDTLDVDIFNPPQNLRIEEGKRLVGLTPGAYRRMFSPAGTMLAPA